MKCILFIADAVRPDYLGCYGNADVDSAAIDALAQGGVRFGQTVTAAPWTAPSTASIISGTYAHKHQVFTWDKAMPGGAPTLFQALATSGHEVASFVFDGDYLFSAMPFANVQGNTGDFDLVCRWLSRYAQQDFFLLVHSWATHMPYQVQHSDRPNWKAAKRLFIERLQSGDQKAVQASQEAYRQAIAACSELQVQRLIDLLQEHDIFDETLFLFMSDHGESWGERFADSSEIQGIHHLHGRFLYDETILVPLIIHWPGRLPAGRFVSAQVRTVDVMPTVLALAGLEAGGVECDGSSLLPLIEGGETGDRPAYCATSEYGRLSRICLRQPPLKYIRNLDMGTEELYDLSLDSAEARNILATGASGVAAMSKAVDDQLSGLDEISLSADEEQLLVQRLRDLGYL